MYKYKIIVSDYECDNYLDLYHESNYTEKEFNKIAEDAILYSIKCTIEDNGYFSPYSIIMFYIVSYIRTLGFEIPEEEKPKQKYLLHPNTFDNINNEELKKMLENPDEFYDEEYRI